MELILLGARFGSAGFRRQEYQTSLIQQVKEDVQRLQEKFKETYEGTQALRFLDLEEVPSPSESFLVRSA